MHVFDALAEPVRRRILELLADGELASGEVVAVISAEFGITQSAISQHLKVLRDSGLARVRVDGARRLYTVDPRAFMEVDVWLGRFRRFWDGPLEALATEIARGKRQGAAKKQKELAASASPIKRPSRLQRRSR